MITLSPAALARRANELFDQDGPARLVLVTCADWIDDDVQSNVVVIAQPS